MPPMVESAAQNGAILGGIILLSFLLSGLGPLLSFPALLMGLSGIWFLFRWQSKATKFQESGQRVTFMTRWSYGIAICFFSALLVAVVTYLTLRFLIPDYISDQLTAALDNLDQTEGNQTLAAILRSSLEQQGIPTPADMMASLTIFIMISGAFFSFIGALAGHFRRK